MTHCNMSLCFQDRPRTKWGFLSMSWQVKLLSFCFEQSKLWVSLETKVIRATCPGRVGCTLFPEHGLSRHFGLAGIFTAPNTQSTVLWACKYEGIYQSIVFSGVLWELDTAKRANKLITLSQTSKTRIKMVDEDIQTVMSNEKGTKLG